MGHLTQRISQFRGINRSMQPNGVDISYAYDAVNVDIVGGRLTNKIGSYRMALSEDVEEVGRPIILHRNDGNYLIMRNKYIALGAGRVIAGREFGALDHYVHTVETVVNDESSLNIRGVGRSAMPVDINGQECIIASGMYGTGTGYWMYRDFYVDGATAKTLVYYLGDEATPAVHARQFGSGLYLFKDVEVSGLILTQDKVTGIGLDIPYTSLTDKQKKMLTTDGIYLFKNAIGNVVTEESINDAYMWLKVSVVSGDANGTVLSLANPKDESEFEETNYAYLRGECSDMTVTFMCMFSDRLFAAAHRSNRDYPRRLYWSRLPGDGRTIEDWTMDDASADTSGGHVDIGDPTDGFITGMIVCGSQLLIFTQNRLWRLYGNSPSNYRLDVVGNLEGTRISNPVEVQGSVYWMTLAGISYYNGSYITTVDDNESTRHLLNEFPQYMKEAFMYSTVHAILFDNSIMFAFDATADSSTIPSRGGEYSWDDDEEVYNTCYVLRYDLATGNVIKYKIPCENYRQQFTDFINDNFGMIGGDKINYETRYIQTLVHRDGTMTLTQWHDWGRQNYGWYDDQLVESYWDTGWKDFGAPENDKKLQTICARGSGKYDVYLETENGSDAVHVDMPERIGKVKDITMRAASGRSMRMIIMSDNEFAIEPYATMRFEVGDVR